MIWPGAEPDAIGYRGQAGSAECAALFYPSACLAFRIGAAGDGWMRKARHFSLCSLEPIPAILF
jgi:hypothetical protein